MVMDEGALLGLGKLKGLNHQLLGAVLRRSRALIVVEIALPDIFGGPESRAMIQSWW